MNPDLAEFLFLKANHLPHWYARWGESGWTRRRGPKFDFGIGRIYERELDDGTILRIVQRGSADRDYVVVSPR